MACMWVSCVQLASKLISYLLRYRYVDSAQYPVQYPKIRHVSGINIDMSENENGLGGGGRHRNVNVIDSIRG